MCCIVLALGVISVVSSCSSETFMWHPVCCGGHKDIQLLPVLTVSRFPYFGLRFTPDGRSLVQDRRPAERRHEQCGLSVCHRWSSE
jgi:hypothetical protein